jgi:hypothetical protein
VAVQHNVRRGAQLDDENLRDAEDMKRYLIDTDLLNLVLHGHAHAGKLDRRTPTIPILPKGNTRE